MGLAAFGWILALLATPSAAAGAFPVEPPVEGPAVVCFMYSRFQLGAGERIAEFSAGLHTLSVEVAGPHGRYTITEGNHLATPRRLGPPAYWTDTLRVHKRREGGAVSYAILGETELAPGDRLVLLLSGPALTGGPADQPIYRRLTVGDPTKVRCDKGFRYGVDVEG